MSRYRELARGQLVGDSYGMLKLLVSVADRMHGLRRDHPHLVWYPYLHS